MGIQRIRSPELTKLSYKKEQELVAGLVVEATTGLTLVPLDPGGGARRLADFETFDSAGQSNGVVEVTTTTIPQRARFNAQVGKQEWSDPNLRWTWSLHVLDTADVKTLRAAIGPELAQLEQAGRTTQWIPEHPGLEPSDPGALPATLRSLGVIEACAITEFTPGHVLVQPKIRGGAYSLDAVTSAVQTEIDKPDNLEKATAGGHGHLFVWLDVSDAQAALHTLTEPPFIDQLGTMAAPKLPATVSVWAAAGLGDWPFPATALLRCDGGPWYLVPLPALTLSDRTLAWYQN